MHVIQPTVSRVLSAFVNFVVSKASQYINMPRNETEISRTVGDFQQISGVPMVLGAIDGLHIPMIAPSIDVYAHINRKQYHSINMLAICDSNLVFQDVVARWPGLRHDSFILQSSAVYDRFENDKLGDFWLLGDSGYPLKKCLITPLASLATVEKRRFNVYHRKTTCVIERCFGVLKMR